MTQNEENKTRKWLWKIKNSLFILKYLLELFKCYFKLAFLLKKTVNFNFILYFEFYFNLSRLKFENSILIKNLKCCFVIKILFSFEENKIEICTVFNKFYI